MSSAQLGREIIEASSLKNFLQSNGLTIPKLYKILSLKPMLIIYAHELQANEHSKALLNYRYKAIQTSFLQHLRSQRLHSWWSFILLLYAVSLCNCVNTSQPSAAEFTLSGNQLFESLTDATLRKRIRGYFLYWRIFRVCISIFLN